MNTGKEAALTNHNIFGVIRVGTRSLREKGEALATPLKHLGLRPGGRERPRMRSAASALLPVRRREPSSLVTKGLRVATPPACTRGRASGKVSACKVHRERPGLNATGLEERERPSRFAVCVHKDFASAPSKSIVLPITSLEFTRGEECSQREKVGRLKVFRERHDASWRGTRTFQDSRGVHRGLYKRTKGVPLRIDLRPVIC